MSPRRLPYLPLSTVLAWEPIARVWGVSEVARGPGGFVAQYRKAGGRPDRLSVGWQIKRDAFILRHLEQIQTREGNLLFDPDDHLPTRHALVLVMWAYFPKPVYLARSFATLQEEDDESDDE